MIDAIINIVLIILFYLTFTAQQGYIAKQLEQVGVEDSRLSKLFKGKWHIAGLIVRVIVSGMFWHYAGYKTGIISAVFGLVFYDSLIDMWRGKLSWEFVGTCEGGWDTDCFWLKLQEWRINHLVVKFIITAITVYFLWR